MLDVVHLGGIDDAVFKEHAGAITTHHRRVSDFEDGSWVVCPINSRHRLLRGRGFCENNRGVLLRLRSLGLKCRQRGAFCWGQIGTLIHSKLQKSLLFGSGTLASPLHYPGIVANPILSFRTLRN